MRGLVFAVVVLAGCNEAKKPAGVVQLPVSTLPRDARVDVFSLFTSYDATGQPRHPKTGETVLCRFSGGVFGSRGDGHFVVLAGSEDGFRRPRAIAILTPDSAHFSGGRGIVHVEGRLVGPTPFGHPTGKLWAGLPPQVVGNMRDHFILLTDARLVAEPRD